MDMSAAWIQTRDLCRYYGRGSYEIRALDKVTLSIDKGEFLAVVGASGSGKSTLLNLLAGLDTPTAGSIKIACQTLGDLTQKGLSSFRASKIGMVFQSFNLITQYSAIKNVEMALYFDNTPRGDRKRAALSILDKLGLKDRIHHRPADLSGGEQQRVAIARALVKKPEILLADEPTGNLDQGNSEIIIGSLTELNKSGQTIILVTHDLAMAQRISHRVVNLKYGKLYEV
jgi:putative ABC transport system ATP-binding protein